LALALVAAWHGSLLPASAQGACSVAWPAQFDGQPGADCPARGDTVELSAGTHTLSKRCDYTGVTFSIKKSRTVLDCDHRPLHAPQPTEAAAIEIGGRGAQEPLEDVTVRNCFIADYRRGVNINPVHQDRDGRREVYWQHEHQPTARYLRLMEIDEQLRARAPRAIRLENVHVASTAHVGIYVNSYVHEVTLETVSVRGTHEGPCLYLDAATRDNVVVSSCFKGCAREGIAVDASAFNRIARSRFERNAEGGIFLYKNANERVYRIGEEGGNRVHGPRAQHSVGNRIEENTFESEKKAVWVASRAAKNYTGSNLFWADPLVYSGDGYKHRRDFAEGTIIVGNRFIDTDVAAVVIEDDNCVVAENYFASPNTGRDTGIYLGSRPREWTGEPIFGTEIRGNRFAATIHTNVEQVYCARGSLIADNVDVQSGTSVPYRPGPPPCADSSLHPALILAVTAF
jgi:hypothetical protein